MKQKGIIFNNSEIDFLEENLEKRFAYLESVFDLKNPKIKIRKSDFNLYFKPIESILAKIGNRTIEYSQKEKIAIQSVVNEKLYDIKKQIDFIDYDKPEIWFSFSDTQRQLLNTYDFYNDILDKTGYFKKKQSSYLNSKFKYRSVFNVLTEMRLTEVIFLSEAGKDNFYKIGFFTDKNKILKIELKQAIHVFSLSFHSTNESIQEIEKSFSMQTGREQARKLMMNANKKTYPKGVLEFIIMVLK